MTIKAGILLLFLGLAVSGYSQLGVYACKDSFDFVPGKVLFFEDDFSSDSAGRFPHKWETFDGRKPGTIRVQMENGIPSLYVGHAPFPLTAYASMGGEVRYLRDSFALEFDFIFNDVGSLQPGNARYMYFDLTTGKNDSSLAFSVSDNGIYGCNDHCFRDRHAPRSYEKALRDFDPGEWHHVSLSFYRGAFRFYLDEHRLICSEGCHFIPAKFRLGAMEGPVRFRRVQLTAGREQSIFARILHGTPLVSHAINFDVNKATIKHESIPYIKQLAAFLKENPRIRVEIAGHTDNVGNADKNKALSKSRAEAVKKELVGIGISDSRLSTVGYGAEKPLQSNDTKEGKQQNRRVEFRKL